SSCANRHETAAAIDENPGAIRNPGGRLTGADNGWEPEFASDDGGVAQGASTISHHGANQRQQDVVRRGGRPGNEYVSLLEIPEIIGAADHAGPTLVTSWTRRDPFDQQRPRGLSRRYVARLHLGDITSNRRIHSP